MSQLMDSKLRCVFELPADATAQAPQNNLDASPALQPHLEAKPSPKARRREGRGWEDGNFVLLGHWLRKWRIRR